MKTQLPLPLSGMKIRSKKLFTALACAISIMVIHEQINAQGSWKAVTKAAPYGNNGNMILLTDGTVMAKTSSGGSDGIGSVWVRLIPDSKGSYANGTWSTAIPAMGSTRLYYSSQVLKDGRVYVAGGEFGTGGKTAEVYNPLTNAWTTVPATGKTVSDANSMLLDDGRVLQALVDGTLKTNVFYNPGSNSYTTAPNCAGVHNESSWVKLEDNSVIMVDRDTKNSERYIPSQNKWVSDATVPVNLYLYSETGAAFLLPDGRAFYIGAAGNTAIYTPSGSTSPGTWKTAATIPDSYGTTDGAAGMMVNGKIICAFSPIATDANHYPSPTAFYEYDYTTNTFTKVGAPGGGSSRNVSCYSTHMLDLPDGTVLYTETGSKNYFIYTPDGSPLAAGKPTIKSVKDQSCKTFTITGTLFNGISEGAVYGDDEQMATNYPIVRLTSSSTGNVYYARTYNWNSTGVLRGNKPDTAEFTLPSGFPDGDYSLVVTANGNASDPLKFVYPCVNTGIDENENVTNTLAVYPNPANEQFTLAFNTGSRGNYLIRISDLYGRMIMEKNGEAIQGDNTVLMRLNEVAKGMYTVTLQKENTILKTKIVIQ